MLAARRSLVLLAVGALTTTGLLLGPVAAETSSPAPVAQQSPDGHPAAAAGVIVKTTTSTASAGLVRAAERALPEGVELADVRTSAAGGRTSVLPTSERVTAADAEAVAAELHERSDVVWASPNYIVRPHLDPPVPATDPYFVQDRARAVWDWRAKTDARVNAILGSVNTFGAGGFSSRAPYAWRATRGAGAVVAVLDTGITTHPDLPTWNGTTASGRMLPGYDFVSRYEFAADEFEDTGRDGDGWDANPQDRGDWENPGDCAEGSPGQPSSWHGTHVAGIIAASKDGRGVVGIAPEATILPIRVLGLCGGTFDDFIAAMKWSVGLPVTDPVTRLAVPVNHHPADVVNMSLGGYASCSGPDAMPLVEAIAAVRATGAVVVASAGNDGVNLATDPVVPATCAGVLAVGATSEYGDRAGYRNGNGSKAVYSNYGSAVDLMAPGGDVYWGNGGIVSSVNSGNTTPVGPAYEAYLGTSMSAPVVSAAAALLKSVNGHLTAAETEAAVKASVQPFPRGRDAQFKACSTSICGTGIIDLGAVQAPSGRTTISGTPTVGEPLSAVRGSWSRTPSSFGYQWLRNGSPISGATGATYYPVRRDVGARLSARMRPGAAAYSTFGSTSAATAPVPDGPQVTLTGLPSTVKYGVGAKVTVRAASGGVPVDGVVELRRGSTVLARRATTGGTAVLAIGGTTWVAGRNVVRAAFVANRTTPAASSPGTTVTVARASSSVSTSLRTRVSKKSRATIAITVKVAGVANPPGQLVVYDRSKRLASATLSSSGRGKRSIRLPRLAKGNHYLKVVYAGSSVIAPKTSTTRRITSY